MNDEQLDMLRYKSEGPDIDFKQALYRFIGGSEEDKAEMLKDILAMANAWRGDTGYILLGLKERRPHPAEVVGITDSIDDAKMQQFVHGKVKPKLTFKYEEHLYDGKTVGVISIPKQKRAFYLAHAYGKLKSNVVYVRRGSTTDEAEPPEVAAMALADAGRGQMSLDLSVLTPDNEALPESVALKYLAIPPKLPDYESPPERLGAFEMSVRSMWHDNKDFWREYAHFAQVNGALIEMKFVLKNRSETSLSNAKLEVSVEPIDGQSFQMMAGADLPDEPSSRWSSIAGMRSLPQMLDRREARLVVDEDGTHPLCHVRFGSLLPGEEGRSTDTLALVPSGPGRLRLHFRILAGELPAPQLQERTVEATGEAASVDVDGLGHMYGQVLLARYEAESRDEQGE